ncbi:MAG: FGGY-family carbohydrate kinase [Oscillospiraceae bacterium]
MPKFYMGIDIGTNETKGVLTDEAHEPLCSFAVAHTIDNPKPNFFEQDAEKIWWGDFCKVSRGLLKKSGVAAEQIAAVGASVMGCDCLPVDENCHPLRPAILYGIDARSQDEILELTELFGEEGVNARFGHPLCSDDVATKILWLKNKEPEIHQKAHKILTGSSYIGAKLTDNYVIDQFLAKAAFRPLYREDGSIDEEACGLFCKPSQLAECKTVTELAGVVTKKAAAETGLAPGTPVITGTGDSTAEAISVGIVETGDLMFQFGSSLFFYCCSDHMITDPRIHGGNFTVPDTFSVSGGTNAAGTLIRWLRDNFFQDFMSEEAMGGENAYAAMAKTLPPSAEGLIILPYFAGERSPINDPRAKGMIFGLTTEHKREHIYRAALEAVGFSVNQNLKLIEDVGLATKTITAVGGGTKNTEWMQLVADITGKEIRVPAVSIGACFGDALMAAMGVGDIESFAELKKIIRPGYCKTPNGELSEMYENKQKIYDELYTATKHLMYKL